MHEFFEVGRKGNVQRHARMVAHLTGIVKDSHCIAALAPDGQKVYAPGMAERLIHDTAFAIASALTEKMDYKLGPAEQQAFHRLAYETCKAAIRQHEMARDREAKRVQGRGEKG